METLKLNTMKILDKEYSVSENGHVFDDKHKFVGWLKNGNYIPSDIIERKERIDLEAKKRLYNEKFERDVKKRMDEIRDKSKTIPSIPNIPKFKKDLPTTREGYRNLAKLINDNGGIDGARVNVYDGCSLYNVNRYFIRKLGLFK